MTIIEVLEKVNSQDIEKVVMNYEGDIEEFETLEDFEEEVYDNGLEEEEVKGFNVKRNTLTLVI